MGNKTNHNWNLRSEGTKDWRIDLIPLRMKPKTVLDLCYDKDDSIAKYLGKLGDYTSKVLDENTEADKALPFADKSIGFTCAFNILKHLDTHQQQYVINEVARISNQACLTYPSSSKNLGRVESELKLPEGMEQHYMPNGDLLLAYNLPVVAVIGDGRKRAGGANQVIENIKLAVRELGFSAYEMYVNVELSWTLPSKLSAALWPLHTLRIKNQDTSNFDAIITVHPSSHYLRHPRHLVYFMHHARVYYDLYPFFLEQFNAITRLGFWFVTRLMRYLDNKYLLPNMRRSKVIAMSETVARRLITYNKLNVSKVIYPGGYLEYVPDKGAKNPKPVALSFSRINVKIKGIDLIIETAKLLNNIEFIIAGTYDGRDGIPEEQLPPNVKLIARQTSDAEKYALYSSCDTFLAPYVDEDFGITPIEANSFGKPVVFCEDSGGLLETQKHLVTGYMTERDPKSFATGIKYCISHAEEMRERCLDNAKRFTWKGFRENIASEIKSMLL